MQFTETKSEQKQTALAKPTAISLLSFECRNYYESVPTIRSIRKLQTTQEIQPVGTFRFL
ncbi:hypothetical protein IQ66_18510 [Leptospira borgpetersenii serovar Ballum]|nr:hypothetical protein IQ66_18510 [Leptospira borgpetersenii serovar Ballum]